MDIEPIKSKKARTIILSILGLLAILIAVMAVMGDFPKEVIPLTPEFDLATICAACFGLACVAGLVCIFVKSIRRPVLITVCVGTVVLLVFACVNFIIEKISYKVAKGKEPVERLCVVSQHSHQHNEWVEEDERGYQTSHESNNWNMAIRFLDNGKEETLSDRNAVTYWELEKGDTCVAYVRTGLFGLQFVTYLKLYTPPLELDDDFERIGD